VKNNAGKHNLHGRHHW